MSGNGTNRNLPLDLGEILRKEAEAEKEMSCFGLHVNCRDGHGEYGSLVRNGPLVVQSGTDGRRYADV